uniref:Phtf-FEM1B_bdg domain-containing protein n=1 Tax=Macrostomum lignano TaxID=282301 RepID=A0A1I8FA50_9PLAT
QPDTIKSWEQSTEQLILSAGHSRRQSRSSAPPSILLSGLFRTLLLPLSLTWWRCHTSASVAAAIHLLYWLLLGYLVLGILDCHGSYLSSNNHWSPVSLAILSRLAPALLPVLALGLLQSYIAATNTGRRLCCRRCLSAARQHRAAPTDTTASSARPEVRVPMPLLFSLPDPLGQTFSAHSRRRRCSRCRWIRRFRWSSMSRTAAASRTPSGGSASALSASARGGGGGGGCRWNSDPRLAAVEASQQLRQQPCGATLLVPRCHRLVQQCGQGRRPTFAAAIGFDELTGGFDAPTGPKKMKAHYRLAWAAEPKGSQSPYTAFCGRTARGRQTSRRARKVQLNMLDIAGALSGGVSNSPYYAHKYSRCRRFLPALMQLLCRSSLLQTATQCGLWARACRCLPPRLVRTLSRLCAGWCSSLLPSPARAQRSPGRRVTSLALYIFPAVKLPAGTASCCPGRHPRPADGSPLFLRIPCCCSLSVGLRLLRYLAVVFRHRHQ